MKRIYILLLCIVHCILCVEVYAQTRRDGEFLFNKKRYKEAYDVYVKLMNHSPKDNLLKYKAARCLFELGRYDEAEKLFEITAENGIKKSSLYLGEIYFADYRFEDAAMAFSQYIENIEGGSDSLLNLYNNKLFKSNLGASMIERVEDIAIIDSMKVHKADILSAYSLPRDLGRLALYNEILGDTLEQIQMVYYTGRSDKMIFANKIGDDQLDLKVSYRLLGGWSEPSDLSVVLNTSEDENYPFELPDGVTLYFASKGHNSLGGYDIFLTRYSTTIEDYSAPVNIGMPFNSPANDYFYVFDEMSNVGWFATDRYQHSDTVVVYEFVPNKEKLLIKTEDVEYKRLAAQMKVYRKVNTTTEKDEEDVEMIMQDKSEFNFFLNDGVVYTRIEQFVSEEAKNMYLDLEKASNALDALNSQLEDNRRKYFFATTEDEKTILREEILNLEKEVRKHKILLDELILQVRKEEIKSLSNKK